MLHYPISGEIKSQMVAFLAQMVPRFNYTFFIDESTLSIDKETTLFLVDHSAFKVSFEYTYKLVPRLKESATAYPEKEIAGARANLGIDFVLRLRASGDLVMDIKGPETFAVKGLHLRYSIE